MKLFSSLIAMVAATNYATTDSGADCLTGWTSGTGTCDPPSELTDSISCSAMAISVTIKPSHVFEHYDRIPTSTLSTLKVQIAGASGSYQDWITFGKFSRSFLGPTISGPWIPNL